jgi:hypothetical protein
VPFELVLAPGLRSSGGGNDRVLNNFVLGGVGHSHALRGMQLSLAANIVDDEMRGVQLSPGMNLVRGSARGLQTTSGANVTLGDFRGLQDGVINYIGGELRGVQIGVAGAIRGGMRGLQINVASAGEGEMRGMQMGVVSVASRMYGPQIAVVNVGGTVSGMQLGVVNVASKVNGLQLGVVNVADSVAGASVGVVSLVRDGYHRLAFWSSDLSPTNIGFKLGSRHVYTLLGFGVSETDDHKALMHAQAGLGVHVSLGDRLFLDIDGITSSFGTSADWSQDGAFSSLRAVVGWQIFRHLAVTVGPTFNVHVVETGERRPGLGWLERTTSDGDTTVRFFPGFVAGLQI